MAFKCVSQLTSEAEKEHVNSVKIQDHLLVPCFGACRSRHLWHFCISEIVEIFRVTCAPPVGRMWSRVSAIFPSQSPKPMWGCPREFPAGSPLGDSLEARFGFKLNKRLNERRRQGLPESGQQPLYSSPEVEWASKGECLC